MKVDFTFARASRGVIAGRCRQINARLKSGTGLRHASIHVIACLARETHRAAAHDWSLMSRAIVARAAVEAR